MIINIMTITITITKFITRMILLCSWQSLFSLPAPHASPPHLIFPLGLTTGSDQPKIVRPSSPTIVRPADGNPTIKSDDPLAIGMPPQIGQMMDRGHLVICIQPHLHQHQHQRQHQHQYKQSAFT